MNASIESGLPTRQALLLVVALSSVTFADDVSFKRVLIDDKGPRNPWIKIVGDLDGDGLKDVAIGGSKGPLVWYSAPEWKKRTVAAGGYSAVDGEAADVDADGDLDIVMGGVLWYENPGKGAKPGGDAWKAHSIGRHNAHDLEVGDLDRDGKLDVVTRDQSGFGHRDGHRILIWRQENPESWQRREIRCPHGEGLALGDLDRDGDLDIVIGGRWYENGGDVLAGDWQEHVYSTSWDRGDAKVALGDLNGDDRVDVVLSPAEPKGETYRIAWYEAPGRPRGAAWTEHTIEASVETVVHALGVADVTGDGKPDVVSAEMHQGKDPDLVVVHVNGGDGKRWTRQVVSRSGSHNILLADMDGDGDIDIVGANHGGSVQPIEMWRNASEIFEPGAKPELVLEKGAGEGPAWHPERGLFFSGGNRITRLEKSRKTHVFREPAGSNGLLFDRRGRLIVCEPGRRRVTRIDTDGKLTVLTERYDGKRYNTPNDVTIDSKGRIYFSDPRYGRRDGMEILDDEGKPIEGVYRIDTDGTVARIIAHDVDRPNGVLVSRDDRFLFVADNNNNAVGGARKLWRFELRADGTVDPATRRLLFDWETGRGPDGMVQDTAGRLYVAGGLNKPHPPAETASRYKGGVYVLTPEGKLLDLIAVPRDEVTNCTFGDADLRTLYITAGGTLWRIRTRTPGWLPWPSVH